MRICLRKVPLWCMAALSVVAAGELSALTWEFDDAADGQAWQAKEGWGSSSSHGSPLRTAVEDGVWRVWLTPPASDGVASARMISPYIRQPSERFDTFRLRVRLMEGGPARALIDCWVTFDLDGTESREHRPPQISVLSTTWQEVDVASVRGTDYAGELLARVEVHLIAETSAETGVPDPLALLPGLEVDWLMVTGVGEQIEGEEPLPPVEEVFVPNGDLLAPAQFWPLVPGIGDHARSWRPGGLGDADADGDLDVVALWFGQEVGFAVGTNDGEGRLTLGQSEVLVGSARSYGGELRLADLDGDRRVDVLAMYGQLQLLRNRDDGQWEAVDLGERDLTVSGISGVSPGQQEAWVYDWTAHRVDVLSLDPAGKAVWQMAPIQSPNGVAWAPALMPYAHAREDEAWVWGVPLGWSSSYNGNYNDTSSGGFVFSYLDEGGEVTSEARALPMENKMLIRRLGDLDGDGDVDVLGSDQMLTDLFQGLNWWRNEEHTGYRKAPILPQVAYPMVPLAVTDLDRNGCPDILLTHLGEQERGLVVLLGTTAGTWTVEGFYPLEGQPGTVLTGDLDGDGDEDVAVLNPNRYGEGGVYVFKSRVSGSSTVVAPDEISGRMLGLELRVYPNPANPQTLVQYNVPKPGGQMDLAVYDLLGQRVRVLVQGMVSDPGVHVAVWSGTDEAGRPVASGVYLLRLQSGSQQQACRIALVR